LGTISAFTYRHRETKKILCRGGRSQDLPDTDFWPAIRQLKYVRCTPDISRIAVTKIALNKKKNLFTSKIDLNLSKELAESYICNIASYGAET